MSITELWGTSEHKAEKKQREEAQDRYQVREFKGEIWLTFDGWLVCPESMLKDDIVTAVNQMRKLYVERNTKHDND